MIKINTSKPLKKISNFWNNIVFHPTDAIEDDWGQIILNQISKDNVAKYVRIYAMFEDIYSLNEKGELLEDYSLNDYRIDYLLAKGFTPMISYAFIPKFLASDINKTSVVAHGKTRYKGKTINVSMANDISMWNKLCYLYTKHIVDKYGINKVKKWRLQCWNEPDCHLFFLSDLQYSEEDCLTRANKYYELYVEFIKATKTVDNSLQCGGPAFAFNFTFLDRFLFLVKQNNIDLDFFSFHIYGTDPNRLNDNTDKLNVNNLINKYLEIKQHVDKYFPNISLIMDEWGASAWGFFNLDNCKKLIFRENNIFAVYYGKLITEFIRRDLRLDQMYICLSGQHELTKEFTGYRGFFTKNGIKKPIYNAYALSSYLKNNLLYISNENGLAVVVTKDDDNNISLMVCYSDDNYETMVPDETIEISLDISLTDKVIEQYIIDDTHSNPIAMVKDKNINDDFSNDEIVKMKEIASLKPCNLFNVNNDKLSFKVTNNSFTLINIKNN